MGLVLSTMVRLSGLVMLTVVLAPGVAQAERGTVSFAVDRVWIGRVNEMKRLGRGRAPLP